MSNTPAKWNEESAGNSIMKIISPMPENPSDFIAEVHTYMGEASLHLYAMGFLELAEIAVDRAVQNRCSIDAVMPAVLYSVRHSVELFLKHVILHLEIEDKNGKKANPKGHKLFELYKEYQGEIALYLEKDPQRTAFGYRGWMVRFEEIVKAVDEIDSDGQTLRYPANTAGQPNLDCKFSVSTTNLKKCIAQIRKTFEEFNERNC